MRLYRTASAGVSLFFLTGIALVQLYDVACSYLIDVLVQRSAALEQEGRRDEAAAQYERALLLAEKLRGADHLQTAETRLRLGIAYRALQRLDAAESQLIGSLKVLDEKRGKGHLTTSIARYNLGNVYYELEQYARAEPLLDQCYAVRRASLPKEHTMVTQALNDLARTYSELGRYEGPPVRGLQYAATYFRAPRRNPTATARPTFAPPPPPPLALDHSP